MYEELHFLFMVFLKAIKVTLSSFFLLNSYGAAGELYVAGGLIQGEYILDLNGNQMEIIVNNPYELILIKLSANKELQWIKRFATDGTSAFNGLFIDHNGFINATGAFHSNMNFEGTATNLIGTTESGFIARWTPDGELVWAHTISDGGTTSINDVCINAQNEMYIGGWFTTYSTDFDFSDNSNFDLGVTNDKDAFLAKYTIADPTPDVFVEQGWQSTEATEDGATDVIYVRLSHAPASAVQVTVTPNSQLDIGNGQGVPVVLNFAANATAVQQQAITVTAFNDFIIENMHTGLISFSITSADPEFNTLTENSITVSITDNDVIGVEELETASFTLSPNPATNEVVLSFAHHQNNTTIHVFDETGKLVLTEQANGTQHRMPIAELATGTYTVSIASGNQKLTKVFLKR